MLLRAFGAGISDGATAKTSVTGHQCSASGGSLHGKSNNERDICTAPVRESKTHNILN
jgi:hypothetical protein